MGIKITEYPNTQVTFDPLDLFDLSAYIAPDEFQSRKVSFATLVSQLELAITGLPDGTQGHVLGFNGGNWVSTGNVFIDFTNSRVGIGTTTPSFKIDTKIDSSSTFVAQRLQNTNVNGKVALRFQNQDGYGVFDVGRINDESGWNNGYGDGGHSFVKANNMLNLIGSDVSIFAGQSVLSSDIPRMKFTSTSIDVAKKININGDSNNGTGDCLVSGDFRIKDSKLWFQTQFALAGYTSGFTIFNWDYVSPITQNCYLRVSINGTQMLLHATLDT